MPSVALPGLPCDQWCQVARFKQHHTGSHNTISSSQQPVLYSTGHRLLVPLPTTSSALQQTLWVHSELKHFSFHFSKYCIPYKIHTVACSHNWRQVPVPLPTTTCSQHPLLPSTPTGLPVHLPTISSSQQPIPLSIGTRLPGPLPTTSF